MRPKPDSFTLDTAHTAYPHDHLLNALLVEQSQELFEVARQGCHRCVAAPIRRPPAAVLEIETARTPGCRIDRQRGHRKGRSIQRRGSVRSMSAPVGLHGIGGALSPYPFVPTVFRTGGTIIPNCTLPTRPPLRRERIFPEQGPPKLPVALEARQVVRGLVHELDAAVANVLTGVSYAAPAATAAPVEHLPVSTAHPNHHGNAARNTRRTRWNALKTPSNLSKSGSPPISRNLRCRYRAPCARRKPGSIVAPRTSSYPKQPAPFQCARAGRAKEMKVRLECLPVTGFPDPAGERCGGLNPPSSR